VAAALTGTPTAIVWAAGATPASQNITIPGDATAVYLFGDYYSDGSGTLATATLAGAGSNQLFEVAQNTNGSTVWVAAFYNPPTGSQALAVTFDDAPTEGPISIVAYVTGGDTTAWRDADGAVNTSALGTTALSVTLTTVAGDLVIKLDSKFGGTAPGTTGGWTSVQTQTNNSHSARLSTISAAGVTQVADAEDEDYSALVAISIPTAAGGGGGTAKKRPGIRRGGMLGQGAIHA
jgi:hypothetical protein